LTFTLAKRSEWRQTASSTYTPTRGAQWFQNAVQPITAFPGTM